VITSRRIPALFTAALIAAMLSVVLIAVPAPAAAAPGDAPVTGSFFVDYDFDGEIDPGEEISDSDPFYPAGGIAITAHDSAGASVPCVVTPGAPPTYSCDVVTLGAGPFRIELGLDPADVTDGWSQSFRGVDSPGGVQFANAGDNVTFGVKPPAFCPDSGSAEGVLFTTCVVHGERNSGGPQDVVVALDYDFGSPINSIGEKSTLGSVWGIAYDEFSGTLYTSAHLQRNVDHGVEGIDGLYWNDYPAGTSATWNSVSLDNLGGPTFGNDPVRDLNAFDQPARDADAFEIVGKTGIGDIDITPNGRYLAVANLESKVINVYDLAPVRLGGTPTYSSSITLSNPGCSDSDWMPWAIKNLDADQFYVGITCTAETSGNVADLAAYVVPVSLSTGTQGAPVLTTSLDYDRGCTYHTTCPPAIVAFRPWSSDVNNPDGGIRGHMPLLADIEVDPQDGSLVLGFIDRSTLQHPDSGWEPTGGTGLRQNPAGGELLRACNVNGVFVMEGLPGCPGNFVSPSGPGFGTHHGGPYAPSEYYGDESYPRNTTGYVHSETALGGLFIHPVINEVTVATMDPLRWVSGGMARYDNTTGALVDGRTFFRRRPLDSGYMGKGLGIGDIEGCWLPVEIGGNHVWLDLDNDGIQDPNEQALAGVTVTLRDASGAVIATTTTGPDGSYSFTSYDGVLPDTAYTVSFDPSTATNLPAGITPGMLDVSPSDAGANDEIDSDGIATSGTIADATITTGPAGTVTPSVDTGFAPPADNRIGNLIWLDSNNNATVDSGEPGLAGITVELYEESGTTAGFDATDTLQATTTTDSTGNYWFDNLLEDVTYYVAVPDTQAGPITANGIAVDPASIASSTGGDLTNNNVDNGDDGDPATGFASVSGPIDLADGQEATAETDANTGTAAEPYVEGAGATPRDDDRSNLTVDLGFTQANRIGNLVWIDGVEGAPGFNDGIADASEAAGGIGGVTVQLFEDSATAGTPGVYDAGVDSMVDSTTTDADGSYWFDTVPNGNYFVGIPDGQTGQTAGGNAIDLDDYLSSTAATSDANLALDDVDDGAPAPGFASLSGSFEVATAANPTDEAGDFQDATADGQESDINSKGTFFADQNSDLSIDFGFIAANKFALGNLVWVDTNDNGLAEAGEPGIEGVTVELLDASGNLVATTVTDANGHYVFTDLKAGDYQVSIPAGQTGQVISGAAADLEDLLPSQVQTADPDAPADIDNDNNGVDPATAGGSITSGLVSIGDPDVLNPSEPTNETLRSDDATADDDGGLLTNEQRNLTVDFGFVQPLRVGNLVWLDDGGDASGAYTNTDENDGEADPAELGIEGVLVQLIDNTGAVIAETVTDATGNYWFDGLRAGDYQVGIPGNQTPQLGAQSGLQATALNGLGSSTGQSATGETADDDDDGDPSGAFASLSQPFNLNYTEEAIDENGDFADGTVGAAETGANTGTSASTPDANSNLEIDFGFSPIATYRLGNLVWVEADDDGIAEPGEPGIDGLLIQLLDDTGIVIAETITDLDGHYLFDELPAGDYQVRIPDDQVATLGGASGIAGRFEDYRTAGTPEPAADGNVDNDNNGVQDALGLTSGLVTLGDIAGEPIDETLRDLDATLDEDGTMIDNRSNLTVDFGLTPLYRLGNLVWEDFNNDGIADPGEPGIEGVLVQLLDDTGTVIAETVTDADGHYLFDGLDAGDYQVNLPGNQTPVLADPQPGIIAGALDDLTTSGAPEADAEGNTDNDNNGVATGSDHLSGLVTLGGDLIGEPLAETLRNGDPTLDEDGAYPDTSSNLTVDFGFFRGLRLGNQVFLDGQQGNPGYNNGIFDAGEVGISGAAVELWLDDGDSIFDPAVDTLLDSTVTDSDGNYLFDDLDPNTPYFVAVQDIGQGFATTAPITDAPTDADNTNDGAPTAGYDSVTAVVTLADPALASTSVGEQDTNPAGDALAEDEANATGAIYPDTNSELHVDLGFIDVPLYRLGNLVWEDVNNDGIAEPTEAGIAGVDVELLDASGASGHGLGKQWRGCRPERSDRR